MDENESEKLIIALLKDNPELLKKIVQEYNPGTRPSEPVPPYIPKMKTHPVNFKLEVNFLNELQILKRQRGENTTLTDVLKVILYYGYTQYQKLSAEEKEDLWTIGR